MTNIARTYAVTVVADNGNKYRFDGSSISALTLDLEEGKTYRFTQEDNSNSGHPFRFSTTPNGTHGGGVEYTTGVTTAGTPGSSGAYTQITVAYEAPLLYYYCTVHSGMGGAIRTQGFGINDRSIAFAHYLTLRPPETTGGFTFQNYWVGEDAPFFNVDTGARNEFGFMPFAFSGATVTKTGDNSPASLAFPNNELSRPFATTVVDGQYLANVRTVLINPNDKEDYTLINRYIGQIVSAQWSSTALTIQLASVFDAVGSDIPRKRLTRQLVGHLPLTSRVRVA
tara:strand:- start:7767 stop:8615 length:849 start_codon:yes stop_codon:yes gene_type:complete